MPPLPGEERVLTVFADVHYYFEPPSAHPRLHRFDKGSYLYIYHDGVQHRTRIEIANNPGTPELDAFCGSLESVHVGNSDRFPTLCTLTVDGHPPTATQNGDVYNWRLMYRNPHDGSGDYFRLHTLDIYLWTLDDAKLFLATAKRLLAPCQLGIASSGAQEQATSSLVQQLEHAAVSDPSYRNSQMTTSGVESVKHTSSPPSQAPQTAPTTTSQVAQPHSTSGSVSGPESSAAQQPSKPTEKGHSSVPYDAPQESSKPSDTTMSNNAPNTHNPAQQPSPLPDITQSYAPMAYNPAAPAAPEPVQHREKTPPPADVTPGAGPGMGTGHATASVPDQGHDPSSAPSHGLAQGQSHHAPAGMQQPYSSPPPSAGLPQHAQMPPHSAQPQPPGSLSFSPPPTTTATSGSIPAGGQPASMIFERPPQDPNAHLYHQSAYNQHPTPGQYNAAQQGPYMDPAASQTGSAQYPHQQQQPPMAGYAEFSYNQPYQQPPQANPYSIHTHAFRPTGAENMSHYQGQPGAMQADGSKPGMITENAMRVEKGVNRLFKKLEKRL